MATPDPTPIDNTDPGGQDLGSNFYDQGNACLVSGGVGGIVGAFGGPPGIVAGFAEGCIAGAGLEATAEFADSQGYPDVANVLRLGGGFNDVASFFG